MAQVSIGAVENLEAAMRALEVCFEQARDECMLRTMMADQKVEQTGEKLQEAEQELEEARNVLHEVTQAVEQAEKNLSIAEEHVQDSEVELENAQMGGGEDEDGNFIPPDCSSEEAALVAAEAEVEEAQRALEELRQQLEEANERCEIAEQCTELCRTNHEQARELSEQVKNECEARLAAIGERVDEGKARLAHALQALQEYLAANPEAQAFYNWLHWTPPPGTPVGPQTIHDRLNLSPAQRKMYVQYLCETDAHFRGKVAGYRSRYDAAPKGPDGDAERAAVLTQMRRNLSGEYAEKFVVSALGVLGTEVKVHVKHDRANGKYTFTDAVITGLKEPVILGRGEGMSAPKGGSLAIEIKTGKADYLKKQQEHMEGQAEGHEDADASMTLCSRDINDLSEEEEAALREAMRKAGSPMIGMLPKKDDIDALLWDEIQGDNKGYEDDEGKKGETNAH